MDNNLAKVIDTWTVKYDPKSRYSRDDRIKFADGYTQIETPDRLVISQDNTDKFYRVEVKYEDRLDLISWVYYDSPQYWWVIALASDIQDPFSVKTGTLLRIPSLNRALREVKAGGYQSL